MTRQKLRLDWDDNRKRQLVRASQVLFVAIKKSMWFIFIFFIIIYISYMDDSCVLYKLGKYFCHMAIKPNETFYVIKWNTIIKRNSFEIPKYLRYTYTYQYIVELE